MRRCCPNERTRGVASEPVDASAGKRTGKLTGPEHVSLFPFAASFRRLNNCANTRKNPVALPCPIERTRRFDTTAKKESFAYATLSLSLSLYLPVYLSICLYSSLSPRVTSVNLKMFALREPNGVEVTCSWRKGHRCSLSLLLPLLAAHVAQKEKFLSTLLDKDKSHRRWTPLFDHLESCLRTRVSARETWTAKLPSIATPCVVFTEYS